MEKAGNSYITGIEFICQDQPNVNIGYKIPGQRTLVNINNSTSLEGFEVAIGEGGGWIHAIKIITTTNPSPGWLGESYRAFIITKLVSNEEICALTGALA